MIQTMSQHMACDMALDWLVEHATYCSQSEQIEILHSYYIVV